MTVGTGKSVLKALEVLKQHNVEGKKVIVLTLFATPESKLTGLPCLVPKYPTHNWSDWLLVHYCSAACSCITLCLNNGNSLADVQSFTVHLIGRFTWLIFVHSINRSWCSVLRDRCNHTHVYCLAGIHNIMHRYPDVKILTSEVHPSAPTHFGQRYFGTD